jgi:hypothetical protein
MPDKVKVLYDALSGEYDLGAFEDFKSKMSDQTKRRTLYDAVGKSYDLGTFEEFESKIAPSGPVPAAKSMPKGGLPTFQEQVEYMTPLEQKENRFEKAAVEDKKKTGSYMGAIFDSFLSSIDPIKYLGEETFFDAYGYMTGKKLTPVERDIQRSQFRGAFNPALGAAGFADKTQSEEYMKDVQGGWDVTDGFGVKDLKALGVMGARVAGDIGVAVGAQAVGVPMGTTYFLQGYGTGLEDYGQMVREKGLSEDETTKQVYALSVGTVNGLLEKFAFDKIFGKGPAFNKIKQEIIADLLVQTSKGSGKLTVNALEKTATDLIKKKLSSPLKRLGRVAYASGVEGLTEGTQNALEDGVKLLSNKIQGQEVFDEDDIKKNFLKNVVNSAIAGAALGAPMGLTSTFLDGVDNKLVEEIASASNDEELNVILSDLEDVMVRSNASQEEIDLMRGNAQRYNNIKQTIPVTATAEEKSKIISLIDRRAGIDQKINQWNAELEQIDDAMKPEVESEVSVLVDSKDMINDEIREVSTGQQYEYYEEKGKYYKKIGEQQPTEISKSRFELQKIKENATKKSPEQIKEGLAESDISQRQGTEEIKDKEAAKSDIGYRYIIGEEGDDIPITALLNKKVKIKGQPAILYQQGQTVEARIIGTNRIIEIGNVNKLMNELPEAYDIELDEVLVTETPQGYRIEGQPLKNTNENPLDAISFDQNGNVMNVVLTTPAGKRRKFRGQVAKDLAYQIQLKEILKDEEQFEEFLAREHQAELDAAAQLAAQQESEQVQEPTEEQAVGVDETVSPRQVEPTYGRVTDRGADVRIKNPNRVQRKVLDDARRVANALRTLMPKTTGQEVQISLHDANSFEEAVVAAGGSRQDARARGFYMAADGSIHLNMDNIDTDTVLHEGFHPLLDYLEANNPEVINSLFAQLESIPEASNIIEQAKQLYTGDVTQKKEAITDFVAGIADGRITLNPSNFQKIKKFIQDMLSKIGIGQSNVSFMKVDNEQDLVKLANFVTEKFIAGEDIDTKELLDTIDSGYQTAEGKPISKAKIQFSLNNDFSDVNTKTSFTYLKNNADFQELKNSGYITEDQVLDNFVGNKFMLHSPDNAFTGEIAMNGKTIVEGKGGVFFPIRFHKFGYFWASTKSAAKSMAARLNQMIEENGGKIYMALVSSPADKLLSSTTSANGVMEFFASSAIDNAVGISRASVSDAIYKAAAKTVSVKKKNAKGQEISKTVGLGIKIPKTKLVDGVRKPMTISEIKDIVSNKLSPENSTFEDRKLFSLSLIENMVEKIKGTKSEQILGRFFDKGILNTSFKQQGKIEKKYNLSSTNITQSLSEMLSEPMLKGSKSGQVYAILEIEGRVKAIESVKHESYPTAIVSEGENMTRVHILQERENWSDRFADPETGEVVEKDRLLNVFPTSGVSNEPLTLLPKKGTQVGQAPSTPTEQKGPQFQRQYADVVNGFYSPIVKKLNEFKQNNASATKWKEIVGFKTDEAVYSGLADWLNSKKPNEQVSKEYVLKFMKDNRLQISEKTRGGDYRVIDPRTDREIEMFETLEEAEDFVASAREDGDRYEIVEPVGFLSTRYEDYQLPGGKNYKERLVILPGKDMFKSSHFAESNILVHLRMNIRTDSDGKKVFFLEEVQSDWGQKGKKEGFTSSETQNTLKQLQDAVSVAAKNLSDIESELDRQYELKKNDGESRSQLRLRDKEFDKLAKEYAPAEQKEFEARKAFNEFQINNRTDIPKAPFVTDTNAWVKLGLKVALKEAIKEGADRIAWTTGQQQNERYDLRKQVDEITYRKLEDGKYRIVTYKDGNATNREDVAENKLEELLGKDVTDRIINNVGDKNEATGVTSLTGLNLAVGGKGMIAFYGDAQNVGIVGKVAKAVVKELTGKEGAIVESKISSGIQPAIDITPELKQSVKAGMPQFQKAPTKALAKKGIVGITKLAAKEYGRYGVLGKEGIILKEKKAGELSAELATAEKYAKDAILLTKKYKNSVSKEDVIDFMTGKDVEGNLPSDLAAALSNARQHVDNLTERLIQLGVIDDQETIDFYRDNKGKYLLRSYEAIDYNEKFGISQSLYGKGLNIDNVAKKLNNVDKSVVDAALKFLADRAMEQNSSLSEADAMKQARIEANGLLSNAEEYVMQRGLTGSTNVASLGKRLSDEELSPELRALMGEYTDPIYNYYASIFKIASLTSSRQYLNSMKEYGMGKFIFPYKTEDATVQIAGEGSKGLEPLNGLYTFPEIYEALKNADKQSSNILLDIMGRIRKYKTVYNPATHIKNIIGNTGFAISNGHWNYIPEAYKYMRASIVGGDDKDVMRMMDTLNRYGVLNNTLTIGELRQYFKRNESVDDFLTDIYKAGGKNKAMGGKVSGAIKDVSDVAFRKIPQFVQKAYQIEDDLFKILGFVNESNRYAKAKYQKEYDKLSETEKKDIDGIASEIVKDTYPTFTRVPKGVRLLSRGLFLGNFLSFPVESVRVQYNSLELARKEIKSGNPRLITVGASRLAGAVAYNSLFSCMVYYGFITAKAGLTGMLGVLNGDDEDETENGKAIDRYVTPWNKTTDKYIQQFSNGKLVYYDIGSLDSYSYQKKVWNAFWSNLNDKEGFDKAIAKSIAEGVSPFIQLDFAISNISKLRENPNNSIYNPKDDPSKIMKDMSMFVAKQMGPGFVGASLKIADSYNKGEYDKAMNEAYSQIVRRYEVDLAEQFKKNIGADNTIKNSDIGFRDALRNTEKIYKRAKDAGAKGIELDDAYREAVDKYKEQVKIIRDYYNSATRAGVPAKKLNEIMNNSGFSPAVKKGVTEGKFNFPDKSYIKK